MIELVQERRGSPVRILHKEDSYNGRSLAIVVFVVGLLATFVLWRTIRTHEQSEIRWVTKLAAQAIRSDIVTDMEWQVLGLDRLALLWQVADPPQQLWEKNAELYLRHRPGSVAVAWLTAQGERRVLITKRGDPRTAALAFDGVPKELLTAVASSDVAMISAPAVVSGGSRQWAIAHPVRVRGQSRGFIVSFFDLKESLDYILDDVKGLGFSFAVVLPNQAEYLLPGSTREHEHEWGELVDVPLSGVTWQVRVWPKPDIVGVIKSSLPDVTLAAGSTLSLLLALTLYFAMGAAYSSARTRQANEALQREIGVREGANEALQREIGVREEAQEELHRAHAELEVRVQQRTTELSAANAKLEHEVAEHARVEESLQMLTGQLFHLQDEERRRLARELHDGATQKLIALAMNMASLRIGAVSGDQQAEVMNDSVRLIQESIQELRTTSHLLHPPLIDELGLPVTLRSYVDGFSARSGIRVAVVLDPQLGRLNRDLELGIFRVVQESLANVHRHSHSGTANVLLCRDHTHVLLEISDEGTGIPPDVLSKTERGIAGVGIAGMRERVRLLGGNFEIHSGHSGTTIRILLPLMMEVKSSDQLALSA